MEFESFFRGARSSIIIVGTNPLFPHLEKSARFFADLLILNPDLRLTILCESDSENFNQSLCLDAGSLRDRRSYTQLSIHRNRIFGTGNKDGLIAEIVSALRDSSLVEKVLQRVVVRQVNLRLPVNVIEVDGLLWWCITTNLFPSLDSYLKVEQGSRFYADLKEFISFYVEPSKGGIYLSQPDEELIELYDKQGYPRGIFPRACFYTTAFERYSIWGFIFNRKGELLLHQRSQTARDGRGLWDKSIGGHVDLRDPSTYITAKRELVEELFLPEAEFSKYVRADLGDIIHFGEWNPRKRPERTFRETFAGLSPSDWVMFRATDDHGNPLTVTRISDRRIHDDAGNVTVKKSVFRSDVYLFIAPPGHLDTEEQMDKMVWLAEKSGAAQDHRLVSMNELRDWIEQEEQAGKDRETFTDDMLSINLEYRELLEEFSEFVKFLL